MTWVILGAGRSGLSAKALLEKHGHEALLFDENKSKLPLETQKVTLDDFNHPIFKEKNIKFVVSPGVSLEHPLLKKARQSNQDIFSEIDLALGYFKGTLLAVTGTNGKSTTVMMIACLLEQLHFDFAVGGNIGVAASSLMLKTPPQYLVLELSSYQIEASRLLKPHIVILTGISPDHLQRHKSLKGYVKAKWTLFEQQSSQDFAIIEEHAYTQATVDFHLPIPKPKILLVHKNDVESLSATLKFPWRHDLYNAFFALQLVSHLTGKPIQDLAPLLNAYKGLPFRCEIIGKVHSWSIINDSKSTTLDSTLHALTNIKGQITLFLGGLGKGESFQDILKFSKKIKKIIVFGKSGQQIYNDIKGHERVVLYSTLHDAMAILHEELLQAEGDIVFSPACASQDEFIDFEDRGNFFTQHVHNSLKTIQGGLIFEPIFTVKKP
jgi:UDP-N-acetylmuramoylalanine--D-glutamate ligase